MDFDLSIVFNTLSEITGGRAPFPPPPHVAGLFARAEVERDAWGAIPAELNGAFGLDIAPEEWRRLWCSVFTGEVPGMREALAELKDEFRLVALSNTTAVHWDFIVEAYPIFQLLDGWVVSYAEGVAKPDPALYRILMDRHTGGRPPFFYTDDIPRYVRAAQSLGWEASVFSGAGR